MSEATKTPLFNNKLYDGLKFTAQVVLPAVGTLYFALAGIWGLPYGEQVVGTIVAVDAFLGLILGLSTRSYNQSDAKYDGSLEVEIQPDDTKLFSLNLDSDPEQLASRKEITFKVNTDVV